MKQQLLPCPFCGGTDVHMREFGRVHIERFAQCYTCEISVALDAWNRRATQPADGEPVAIKLPPLKPYQPELGRFDLTNYGNAIWNMAIESVRELNPRHAAAHGDEAVRFDSPEALAKALFDHGSIVTSRLVADRIFAAMRAQGDKP